ncbi:MAG: glycogen-debranching protein, partial [Planctomycetes bacterium]|nr:glycogen-debranching protein [Planctomycetota bacterium]
KRGTYLGLLEKIPHLKELGVTAVELMPVFQFDPQEDNYWGYMPISFFVPHNKYAVSKAPERQVEEFRQMVSGLHEAGMEVILDVVYNHTGEGDLRGPVYNLKGIDNATYYLLSANAAVPYQNLSGTGNSLNCGTEATRQLILDSMRYWVEEMKIDGFRFDLASVLARNSDGSLNTVDPPIFSQIAADPLLRSVRLIAEPWDAGGAYQLGCAFPGRHWAQWNDHYRDEVRRFVRGDPDMVAKVMARLYGSSDIFPETRAESYHPYQSLNYISSHDGFTLYDLVSYNQKHNEANGQKGMDGPHENFSWNCGVEGDEGITPEILRLRKQQIKNFFCLLMLSNGTPMFRAGDEFLQTQRGNNNPFNQDNETSWLDWSRLQEHQDIFRFFRLMIALRKAHPSICRSRFWRGDVRWYGVNREVDLTYYSRSLAFCLHGASVGDSDIYAMINSYSEDLIFGIQEGGVGDWKRVVDTSKESPDDILEEGKEIVLQTKRVRVKPRSIVVLTK